MELQLSFRPDCQVAKSAMIRYDSEREEFLNKKMDEWM